MGSALPRLTIVGEAAPRQGARECACSVKRPRVRSGVSAEEAGETDENGEPLQTDKPLVLSFQRSGLNWIRHCAEHFTGRPTPGRTHLVAEGEVLFHRTHDVRKPTKRRLYVSLRRSDGTEIYGRVALLIRDPYACFVSECLVRKQLPYRKA